MLNGISKPLHKLLTLTLVYDVVQVVVNISYVALVLWIQLTGHEFPILVEGLAMWIVVKHRMAQHTSGIMSQCAVYVATTNVSKKVLDLFQQYHYV